MTIASEITRLQGAKADIKTAIEGKWVAVPSSTTLDWYSTLIDSIQTWVPQATYNAMKSLASIWPCLASFWWSSSTCASKSLKCWDYYVYVAWGSSSSWSRYVFHYAAFVWHPQYWCVWYTQMPEGWNYIDISGMAANLYGNWVLNITAIWRNVSINSSTWLLQWGGTPSWSIIETSSEVSSWNWVQWSYVEGRYNNAHHMASTIRYIW